MKFKRTLTIGLASALLVGACASSASPSPSASTAPATSASAAASSEASASAPASVAPTALPVDPAEAVITGVEANAEITFWTFYLSPTFDGYIKDTIARFEATYPTVKVTWADHQATFQDDLNNAFAAGFQGSYNLDLFGFNQDGLRAARENLRQARYTAQVTGLSTLATVANEYFTVLSLRERITIARQNIDDTLRQAHPLGNRSRRNRVRGRDHGSQHKPEPPIESRKDPLRRSRHSSNVNPTSPKASKKMLTKLNLNSRHGVSHAPL